MPRPYKRRFVSSEPETTYYKPRGIPIAALKEVVLTIDELEAIRLVDYRRLSQTKAAQQLKVSQPTLHRILRSARSKLADVVANGKALRIHGGPYKLPTERWFECFRCKHQWSEPFGTGRPEYCPQCDSPSLHRLAHPPK
ncbi:MAG: DUF134 domain-containing protein [Promethearchaeota archaeon]